MFCSSWPCFYNVVVWDAQGTWALVRGLSRAHRAAAECSSPGELLHLSKTSNQSTNSSKFNEHIKMLFFNWQLLKKQFTRGKANEGPVATAPCRCLYRQEIISWIHGLVCELLPQHPETILVGAHGCKVYSFSGALCALLILVRLGIMKTHFNQITFNQSPTF